MDGPDVTRATTWEEEAFFLVSGWWQLPNACALERWGGCREGLRRTYSEVTGAQSGSSFNERDTVNTGTTLCVPGAPGGCSRIDALTVEACWVGRSRRSTPRLGKLVTWGRAAAGYTKG